MSPITSQILKGQTRSFCHRWFAANRFNRIGRWLQDQPDLEGPVAYDIGARWGISAPYDRLKTIAKFRTVGFEPDPTEAQKLLEAKAFDYVCNTGLAAKRENRVLHIAEDPGSSSLYVANQDEISKHTSWSWFKPVREIPISVISLDEAISEKQLPLPDYLKIDCEGAEGEILDGGANTLRNLSGLTFEARLREFHIGGSTLQTVLDRLFKEDFICLRLDPIGSFFGALMMFDVVMVRRADAIKTRRQFINTVIFCLLHRNWTYSQRIVDLRSADFGLESWRKIFRLPEIKTGK